MSRDDSYDDPLDWPDWPDPETPLSPSFNHDMKIEDFLLLEKLMETFKEASVNEEKKKPSDPARASERKESLSRYPDSIDASREYFHELLPESEVDYKLFKPDSFQDRSKIEATEENLMRAKNRAQGTVFFKAPIDFALVSSMSDLLADFSMFSMGKIPVAVDVSFAHSYLGNAALACGNRVMFIRSHDPFFETLMKDENFIKIFYDYHEDVRNIYYQGVFPVNILDIKKNSDGRLVRTFSFVCGFTADVPKNGEHGLLALATDALMTFAIFAKRLSRRDLEKPVIKKIDQQFYIDIDDHYSRLLTYGEVAKEFFMKQTSLEQEKVNKEFPLKVFNGFENDVFLSNFVVFFKKYKALFDMLVIDLSVHERVFYKGLLIMKSTAKESDKKLVKEAHKKDFHFIEMTPDEETDVFHLLKGEFFVSTNRSILTFLLIQAYNLQNDSWAITDMHFCGDTDADLFYGLMSKIMGHSFAEPYRSKFIERDMGQSSDGKKIVRLEYDHSHSAKNILKGRFYFV